ncbi:MAG: hypothetical protein GY719_13335 [bacterium]|nr:hypothetical protein [bacterium]
MGNDVTEERSYRGLLIPDHRLDANSFWPEQSSYDQAGPGPGVPVAERDTEMVLEAVGGEPEGDGLEIRTLRGGHPGPFGASFAWRRVGEQEWRGWDAPRAVSGWESLIGVPQFDGFRHPCALTLSDDRILVVYDHGNVPGSSRVHAGLRSLDGSWSWQDVYGEKKNGNHSLHPCLVALPSGAVLLLHLVHREASSQVRVHRDASGAGAWELASRFALTAPLLRDIHRTKRIRAAYRDGEILLLVWSTKDDGREYLAQFVSDDLGSTFHYVSSVRGGFPDLVVSGGRFLVAYINHKTGAPVFRRLGSAVEPLAQGRERSFADVASLGDVAAGLGLDVETGYVQQFTQGDMALAVDDDGAAYALFARQDSGSLRPGLMVRSTDGGETWRAPRSGTAVEGAWWSTEHLGADRPTGYCATFQRGRLVLFHGWDPSAPFSRSLCALYLGGYSTVTLPPLSTFQAASHQAGWTCNWLASDPPDEGTWQLSTGSPTPSHTMEHGRLKQLTGSGESIHCFRGVASSLERGLIVRFAVDVAQGTASVVLHNDTATADEHYRIEIEIVSGRLTVHDRGTTVATLGRATGGAVPPPVATTNPTRVLASNVLVQSAAGRGVQVLAALRGASAQVWARPNDTGEDRRWTLLVSADDLGGGAAEKTESYVRWGSGASSEVYWTEFHLSYGADTGTQIVDATTGATGLFARAFPTSPMHVADGVRLTAVDGPTRRGDTWRIATAYRHPIHNVLPSVAPSPRLPWRSAGAGEGMSIALHLGGGSNQPSFLGSDLLGLYLDGINWRQAMLQGLVAESWLDLQEIRAYSELVMERHGNVVTPSADAVASGPYLHYGELVGGSLELAGGIVRRIAGNTEGSLLARGQGRVARIYLDGIEGVEPTALPSARIWYPRVLVVKPLGGHRYSAFRLVLHHGTETEDVPPPAAGYFQIGTMALGHVALFGWDSSRGRILSRQPNVELTTQTDGSRGSRRLGPSRRAVELAWAEGVDVTPVQGEGAPDYVRSSWSYLGQPAAARHDTPYLLDGLLDALDGPHTPLVYLPRVPLGELPGSEGEPEEAEAPVPSQPEPMVFTWQRARGAIYGRLTSPVRLESVLGEEESSEVMRVATVTIEEEV